MSTLAQDLVFRSRIAELNGIKRKPKKKVYQQRYPKALQLQYTKELRNYQRLIEAGIRKIIFPELEHLFPRMDALEDDLTPDEIKSLMDRVRLFVTQGATTIAGVTYTEERARQAIQQAGVRIADWQRTELGLQFESIIGIDIQQSEPWLGPHLDEFRRSNANLVTKMSEEELSNIETIMRNGKRRGLHSTVISKDIRKQMGVSESRAILIARDQTNKLHGELNELRQTNLGVEEYFWRDTGDGRVRDRHIELAAASDAGKKYRWDDPPVIRPPDVRGHPGEDIQCRCQSEPVLDQFFG